MRRSIFQPAKHRVPFQEYMHDLLKEATRINKNSNGDQRYSSAQLEIALLSFCDFKALKNEMDPDIEVDFSNVTLQYDSQAGFDWLDLSVSYKDPDAISYFQENLEKDSNFKKVYEAYKQYIRPDCALQNYEEITSPPSLKK
ncbi:hypothetical protein [Legionella maioricensis]|uniref:Uncharacterized protein n=1 Tax=Legionella maioricensis TaxID=2896528 RepID=A0A9X2CXR5_9GAMM|nr:hypothetical protein [Legionella maioricensis]MCL9682666.1 hypothetical protein [Legionella maioricensis]MCL9687287.1 hypothetical protein [Legionella maioricensis]